MIVMELNSHSWLINIWTLIIFLSLTEAANLLHFIYLFKFFSETFGASHTQDGQQSFCSDIFFFVFFFIFYFFA